MLSMKLIGGAAACAGLALVVALSAGAAQDRRQSEAAMDAAAAAERAMASAEAVAPDASCNAGGWIRTMRREGDSYQVELADGTTGTMPAGDVAKICGQG